MNLTEAVQKNFAESIETLIEAESRLDRLIADGAELIVSQLLKGGKVLCCGNGGSAAEAQLFVSRMLNRYERERPGLPAIALTTDSSTITSIASDYDYDEIFVKQITALGHPGDLLLAISTDGDAENINAAIGAAQENDLLVLALSGGQGGRMAGLLRNQDIEIRAPSVKRCRIQEVHLLIIHCLCDLIDQQLLGGESV